jgi:hypothetical protein
VLAALEVLLPLFRLFLEALELTMLGFLKLLLGSRTFDRLFLKLLVKRFLPFALDVFELCLALLLLFRELASKLLSFLPLPLLLSVVLMPHVLVKKSRTFRRSLILLPYRTPIMIQGLYAVLNLPQLILQLLPRPLSLPQLMLPYILLDVRIDPLLIRLFNDRIDVLRLLLEPSRVVTKSGNDPELALIQRRFSSDLDVLGEVSGVVHGL